MCIAVLLQAFINYLGGVRTLGKRHFLPFAILILATLQILNLIFSDHDKDTFSFFLLVRLST